MRRIECSCLRLCLKLHCGCSCLHVDTSNMYILDVCWILEVFFFPNFILHILISPLPPPPSPPNFYRGQRDTCTCTCIPILFVAYVVEKSGSTCRNSVVVFKLSLIKTSLTLHPSTRLPVISMTLLTDVHVCQCLLLLACAA